MSTTISRRLALALTPPVMTSVREFLAARAAGDIVVEDRFFRRLRLANDVFKTTRPDRLTDTFPAVLAAVPAGAPRVLDVACSSGVSTVELHRALAARGGTVETIGTDLVTVVRQVALPGGDALLIDGDGVILAVEIDGLLVDRTPVRNVRLYHPWRVARARRLIAAHRGRYTPGPDVRITDVPLVSSLVDRTPGVTVVQEDILAPTVPGRFDLIRAANILNRSYFPAATLRALAAALIARLAPGGVLFVVRTDDTTGNAGTLWRRTGERLVEIGRVGAGSEAAPMVETAASAEAPRER